MHVKLPLEKIMQRHANSQSQYIWFDGMPKSEMKYYVEHIGAVFPSTITTPHIVGLQLLKHLENKCKLLQNQIASPLGTYINEQHIGIPCLLLTCWICMMMKQSSENIGRGGTARVRGFGNR